MMLLTPYAIIAFEPYGQGVFSLVLFFSIIIVFYYIYGGVAKLLVYMIYFMFTILSLIYLPKDYQVTVSLVSTFVLLINPLQKLEAHISTKMRKEFIHPIKINMSGTYWPYIEYRRDMKEFYHLPQIKKLHHNKAYLRMRQFVTIVFIFLATFLLIQEASSIANDLNAFKWHSFFNIYIVLWLYLMGYYAYKKGLTTVFRTLVLGTIPVIYYAMFSSPIDTILKLVLIGIITVISISLIAYEWYQYFQRVSFDTFSYVDTEKKLKVYANALFEPLIYNDTYILSAIYRIKISLDTFHQHFQKIIVYANIHKILITAYGYGEEMLYVFADFHYRDRKKIDQFKTYMESKFKLGIPYKHQEDRHKTLYEENFFHKTPYIIARAKHLASQLKNISNETIIVVSIIMYFDTLEDVEDMKKTYQITMLSDIYVSNYFTIKIDLPVVNNHHVIESSVKTLLQDMKKSNGQFVRILVSKINS